MTANANYPIMRASYWLAADLLAVMGTVLLYLAICQLDTAVIVKLLSILPSTLLMASIVGLLACSAAGRRLMTSRPEHAQIAVIVLATLPRFSGWLLGALAWYGALIKIF